MPLPMTHQRPLHRRIYVVESSQPLSGRLLGFSLAVALLLGYGAAGN